MSAERHTWINTGVTLTACVIIVVVAVQNRRLEARNLALRRAQFSISAGEHVPPAWIPATNGDSLLLAPPGSRQLLYVLTTSCQYCLQSLPAWRHLTKRLEQRSEVSAIVVSLDSLEATSNYVRLHGIDLPVGILRDDRIKSFYRAYAVPQTVLIDRGGRVVYSRPEALGVDAADSLLLIINALAERDTVQAAADGAVR